MRRLSLYALFVIAIGALLATACTATGDDEDEQDQAEAARAAEVEAASRDAAAAAAAATPYTNEQPSASAPSPMSQQMRRDSGAASVAPITPSRDGAATAASTAAEPIQVDLERIIRADFAEFRDVAWTALPTSPNHVLAWGLGAPSGDRYLIPVRVYDASTGAMLREVALGGGGLGRDDVRIAIDNSPIGTVIEAHGEAGPREATYDALVWDASRLSLTVSASTYSDVPGNAVAPGRAARLQDLDGDGIPEVIADRTGHEPLWYPAGIYFGDAEVMRWDGYQFAAVDLMLDPSMSAEAARLTRAADSLAEAGWLAVARDRAAAALDADPGNETALWNHLVLTIRAEAAAGAAASSPLPWFGAALNGDWAGAVELLREVESTALTTPEAAFAGSPREGVLEGGPETPIGALLEYAKAAIEGGAALSDAELAPAWLIRGLAQWWSGEGYAAAEDSLLEAIPGYWDETFLFDVMYYLRIAE